MIILELSQDLIIWKLVNSFFKDFTMLRNIPDESDRLKTEAI